jgi:hypothetical protein
MFSCKPSPGQGVPGRSPGGITRPDDPIDVLAAEHQSFETIVRRERKKSQRLFSYNHDGHFNDRAVRMARSES